MENRSQADALSHSHDRIKVSTDLFKVQIGDLDRNALANARVQYVKLCPCFDKILGAELFGNPFRDFGTSIIGEFSQNTILIYL
jgi:hypothetical protein